jgi:uncharacterized protein (TIGR03435 family)
MITGAPDWLDSDHFDLAAKAPPNTPEAILFQMLQTLLAERFKLAIHREDKMMPAYVLVVGTNGPKLQTSADAAGQKNCAWRPGDDGLRKRECHNMTMAELARQLPGWANTGIDRQVIDSTELKGTYDFQLEMGPRRRERSDPAIAGASTPLDDGPTIFEAMNQLGLKLEARNRPMPVIVIDHVERVPTEN